MATFSLQVQPENAAEWVETARRAEAAGFAALYVADHPGSCAAPDVKGRIEHFIAVTEATRTLLSGGAVNGVPLTRPRPVQQPVPLLIGGGNTRLLHWAAEHADIIGLGGMGRTLPDGHGHEVRWREHEIDAQVDLVRSRTLEALVQ